MFSKAKVKIPATDSRFMESGITKDEASRFMDKASRYNNNIREAILIILETARGEWGWHPDFGWDIHHFYFSSFDAPTLANMESNIREALTRWEPRIDVRDIKISTEIEMELHISIDYVVRATQMRFNFVFPFHIEL